MITNSTFTTNTAQGGAGGFGGESGGFGGDGMGAAIYVRSGAVNLSFNTVSGNTVTGGAGGLNWWGTSAFAGSADGSVYRLGGTFNMDGVIVANTAGGDDCVDVANTNSLVMDNTCAPALSGDPSLAALANNGGSTQTMAIDAGDPPHEAYAGASCPPTDQRGYSRPGDTNCDIGAFELDGAPPVALGAAAACNGDNLEVTITAGDADFDIAGTGAGLPSAGVALGTTAFTGPGTWTGVTVTENGGDGESLALGDFTCSTTGPDDPDEPDEPGAGDSVVDYFDPAISKIGLLMVGDLGVTGEQVQWVITVNNAGTGHGTGIVVTDTLREELRIDRVEVPAGVTYTISGQSVTVTIMSLAPGEAVQFSIYTTTLAGGAEVNNTACVSGHGRTACAEGWVMTTLPETGTGP
jgi:hypothetical protein